MNRINELKIEYVEYMPEHKKEGVLYVSHSHAIHLCACGCKREAVCALKPHWNRGWKLTENNGLVTLRPSIGNFNGETPYHAHYFITNNKIEWQ